MATNETSTTLPVGYMLQDFEIESVLGVGGFGITYCARDIHLNRQVAIKEYMPVGLATRGKDTLNVFPATDGHKDDFDWGLDRFRLEAETLVAFRHPNIVTVFRYFPANGTAYLVMEYQDGKTLGELIHPDRTLSEEEIREIIFPLLDGLEQVHKAGFMHRDIKPANIFVRRDGKPVLIDFGAARQAIAGHSQGLTSIVTAGYAPYEQYDSETEQGPWTDLYAIGATLYRCVTGERPVEAPRRAGAVMRNNDDPLKPASVVARGKYSAHLLDAVDRAMAVLEQNRPQSVAELRDMLRGDAAPAAPSPDETMIAGGLPSGVHTPASATAADSPPQMPPVTAAAAPGAKSSSGAIKWVAIGLVGLLVIGGGAAAAVYVMNQEDGAANGPVTDAADKAWARAKSLNTVAAYEAFLSQHPNSKHAKPARDAIARLKQDKNRGDDDRAFEVAKSQNTRAAYEDYLRRFPNGRHAGEAKRRLAAIASNNNNNNKNGNGKTKTYNLKPVSNPNGSLSARYARVLGLWCSAKFEINLTRTTFMSRDRKVQKGVKYPVTKIDFQDGYFRLYYLDNKSNEEVAYEFAENPNDATRIHLRRIFYQGAWRSVSSHYTRKC